MDPLSGLFKTLRDTGARKVFGVSGLAFAGSFSTGCRPAFRALGWNRGTFLLDFFHRLYSR